MIMLYILMFQSVRAAISDSGSAGVFLPSDVGALVCVSRAHDVHTAVQSLSVSENISLLMEYVGRTCDYI